MTALSKLSRVFLEPATAAPPPAAPPAADADRPPASAAVVGLGERSVVPVAAAVAGELRARAAAPSCVVALWAPGGSVRLRAGAATPAARRTAARLAAGDRTATACGRLAWLALPAGPDDAARTLRHVAAGADVPVVLAVCGHRPAALEPVLAECQVALAVLPVDADPDLRALALAALPAPLKAIQAPLPPGPPRWAALAGLARLRSLPHAAA